MDQRIPRLPGARNLPSLARLAFRRDLLRLAALDGIRWVGAGEMVDALAAHGGPR